MFVQMAFSQKGNNAKHVHKLLKDAEFFYDVGDYYNALKEYKKVLDIEPKNETANLYALICHLSENHPVDSVLEMSDNLKNSKLTESFFHLGRVNHLLRNFDEALVYFKKYKAFDPKLRKETNEEIDHEIEMCENAKLMLLHPHRAVVKNMGSEINSPWDDYVPLVTTDENTLYFTSRREGSSNNKKDEYGNYFEDIYVSHKKDGTWSKPQNLSKPLNTDLNDACVSLSHDGNRMIIFRTAPDLITGHLMHSENLGDDKWSEPQIYGKEINSQFIETSACFSNDTGMVFFSSSRPGGYGGKDLYSIKRLPNGKWAMPFNLGPTINTIYDEDAPFLHPDGSTLFFSSKGHNTMGGYDVFMSSLNSETNTFSKAENVGFPVNSVNNDIFFVLSADTKHGYYSSMKEDTKGEEDIYMIDTRFGDNDLVVKHGIIYKENEPGHSKITLIDNETKQVQGTYASHSHSGRFILAVNPFVSYRAIIEEPGYNSITIDLEPVANEKEESEINIHLTKKTPN